MTESQIYDRRWAILGVLILALFGMGVDNTVLNIALPTLARDLTASASQLQWMVDAYVLLYAGPLLVAGALSDRFGRRLLLVLGLLMFGVGSAAAPFVTSADQLILLRGFMGVGAALATPSTLSILAATFDARERPKAIAIWASVSGLGIIVGPILGGWLLEHFAWPSVFVLNVPFAVIGIAATLAVVPESRAPGRIPLDPVGALLSTVGLVALVFGIIEEPSHGWTDPTIAASLAIAAVALIGFAAWERRVAYPMLDVGLFRNPRFSAASLSITLVFFSLMGTLFFLTQYLQGVLGLSPLETGIRFIPVALGMVVAAPISTKMTHRLGARITTAFGMLVIAGAMAGFATVSVTSSDAFIAGILFTLAVGMAVAMTPATDAIMGALPSEQFGVGSAVNDTVREVGGALGVAILGSLFAASYTASMAGPAASLPPEAAAAVRDSLAAAAAVAAQIGGSAGAAILAAAREAFVNAMAWTSLIGVAFAIAGALVALAWLPARAAGGAVEGAGEGPVHDAVPAAGAPDEAPAGAIVEPAG